MSAPNVECVRLRSLLRTFVGLKINKVWPWLAIRVIYGWNGGGEHWRKWRRDGSGAPS